MLLSWKYNVLRLHDDLSIDAGPESVKVASGLVFGVERGLIKDARVLAKGANLGRFVTPFVPSLEGFQTGPFSVEVAADGPLGQPDVGVDLDISDIRYPIRRGDAPPRLYQVNNLRVRSRVLDDTVFLDQLRLCSPHGSLAARGQAEVFNNGFSHVRGDIPLDLAVHGRALDLSDIGWLVDQRLEGDLSFDLAVGGTSSNPNVAPLPYNARTAESARWASACLNSDRPSWGHALRLVGLEVMGEAIPSIVADVTYGDGQALLANTLIAYGDPRAEDPTRVRIDVAAFDLNDRSFALEMGVDHLRLQDLSPFRDGGAMASLGLAGTLDITNLNARGDIDQLLGGRVDREMIVEGGVRLSGLRLGELALGDITLEIDTHDDQLMIIGDLLGLFELRVVAHTWLPLHAEASISFYRLPVKDLLTRFTVPFIEAREGALKFGPYKGYLSNAEARGGADQRRPPARHPPDGRRQRRL